MLSSHSTFPGLSHLQTASPCQDFCTSAVKASDPQQPWAYAIVSDGCSCAGRTELGAALLTQLSHSWLQAQDLPPTPLSLAQDLHAHLLAQLHSLQPLLALSAQDLMATLLILITTPHALYGISWGDGALLVQTHEQQVLFSLNSPQNTPSYLAYQLTSTTPPPLASSETHLLFGDSNPLHWSASPTPSGAVAFHIDHPSSSQPFWQWAALSSDGLPPSLISKDLQLPHVWCTPGQFVPRELAYAWRTLWKKQPAKHPSDDCALAVIRRLSSLKD